MQIKFKKLVVFLVLSVALSVQFSRAEIIYRNNTGDLASTFTQPLEEVGDEITLGGANRTLTNFTFQYTAYNFSGNIQGRLRFYYNNAALGAPGTTFFDSGIFNLNVGTSATNNTLIFDSDFGAGLLIPTNSFTWTIRFSNLAGGERIGPSFYDPVTVGENHPTFWVNTNDTPSGWVLRQNGTTNNFGAQLEAIPEPSTVVLGFVGSLLGWGFLRRRRGKPKN